MVSRPKTVAPGVNGRSGSIRIQVPNSAELEIARHTLESVALTSKLLGVLFLPGSGWHAPLSYEATQLKDEVGEPFMAGFFQPLLPSGYPVFVIDHRAAPRFRYPAAVQDTQRAVRFSRHNGERFRIDPDRIGGVGYPSGGHLVDGSGAQGSGWAGHARSWTGRHASEPAARQRT
jgi:acetyl esterase/lipase